MKKIIFTILFLLIVTPSMVSAQVMRLDADNIAQCNQVIEKIFNDVMKAKSQYPELKDFTGGLLTKNKYGLNTFHYKHEDVDANGRTIAYDIALSIVGLNDVNPYSTDDNAFDLGFPLLGMKFSGYQKRTFKSRQFDVLKLIASGKTVSEIGEKLSLSVTTVSTYRARILVKMKFSTNAELTHYAIENKLT